MHLFTAGFLFKSHTCIYSNLNTCMCVFYFLFNFLNLITIVFMRRILYVNIKFHYSFHQIFKNLLWETIKSVCSLTKRE